MATIGALIFKVGADVSELNENTRKISSGLDSISGLAKKAGVAMVAAFAFDAIKGAVMDVAEFTGKLTDLSAKTGVGVEGLQKLKFAGEQSGVSLEQMTAGVTKLQNSLAEGDKSAVGAVKHLGLSVDDLRKMQPDQMFATLAGKIGEVADPADKAKLAIDLFGKSGAEMLPAMTSEFSELYNSAERLGIVLDEQTVAAGDAFGDQLTVLQAQGQAFMANAIAPLMPLLTMLMSLLSEMAGAVMPHLATAFRYAGAFVLELYSRFMQLLELIATGVTKIPWLGEKLGFAGDAAKWLGEQSAKARDGVNTLINPVEKSGNAAGAASPKFEKFAYDVEKVSKPAKAVESDLDKLIKKLNGAEALAAATTWMQAVDTVRMAGHSLSTAQLTEFDSVLKKAIETATLTGQVVPEAWRTAAAATQSALFFAGAYRTEMTRVVDEARKLAVIQGRDLGANGLVTTPGAQNLPGVAHGTDTTSVWESAFGDSKQFGQNVGNLIVGAFQGGGDVGKTVGGFVGQGLGKAAAEGIGNALGKTMGGVLDTVLPGVGSLIVGLGVDKIFDNLFGPSQAAQTQKLREQWLAGVDDLAALSKQADLAGFAMSRLFDARKVKDFKQAQADLAEAMKHWTEQLEAITSAGGGLNQFASGLAASMEGATVATDAQATSVGNLGNMALATFTNYLAHTGDLVGALTLVGPALDVVIALTKRLGLEAPPAVQGLLGMREFLNTHPAIADGLQGLTALIQGLAKAGWVSADMFAMVGQEARRLFDESIANGLPASQALALQQPVLQQLYELQKKFGFQTDSSTQELLDMAQASGIIGDSFRSAADQMVELLAGIKTTIEDLRDALLGLGNVNIPPVRIPVEIDDPSGRVVSGGDLPGYAFGTGGLQDFGRASLAVLHGREAVVPEAEYAALMQGGRGSVSSMSIVNHVQVDASNATFDSETSQQLLADRVARALENRIGSLVQLTRVA